MNKILRALVWPVVAAPLVYFAIAWNKLPDRIATHFDIRGNADKYNSKNGFLLFIAIMVALSIGLYFLISNIYRIDPKKYAAENKGRLHNMAFSVLVFMAAMECLVIYTGTQGELMHKLDLRVLFVIIGLFWAVLGNYMNNLKPNYFAGFRLPWTLENPDNWRNTHYLASKLWFAGGLLTTVIAIFTPKEVAMIAIFIILAVVTIIPIVYSYRYYRKQKAMNSKT